MAWPVPGLGGLRTWGLEDAAKPSRPSAAGAGQALTRSRRDPSSISLPDRSAAEAFLAVIKHGVLARSDPWLGLIHENLETSVLEGFNPTADQLWGVANSKVEPIFLGGICDPVGIADGETISVIGLECAGVRDQEFIGLGVFPDHIPGPT